MDREISIDPKGHLPSEFLAGQSTTTLREVLNLLHGTYCATIGIEDTHIQEHDQRNWIREYLASSINNFCKSDRVRILDQLAWADQLDHRFQRNFLESRFGLDGCESLVPGLNALVDAAADLGVKNAVIGMSHRGRLNVLANVLRKPLPIIFNEINKIEAVPDFVSGDVRYHLGGSVDHLTCNGKNIHLSLVANPSHLEAVDPVVEGKVRAKQHCARDTDCSQVMPIIMHGDAAFAGQGVVYETFQLSQLKDYTTGGTIHIVINNQIATTPNRTRTTRRCTDIAKTFGVPILHVNGDDPEAVVCVMQLAAKWRQVRSSQANFYFLVFSPLLTFLMQSFHLDIVVDIVCYRRNGYHYEPHFTHPAMYQHTDNQVSVMQKYATKLISKGVVTQGEYDKVLATIRDVIKKSYEEGKETVLVSNDSLGSHWTGFKNPTQVAVAQHTGVKMETLQAIGEVVTTVPEGFTLRNTTRKFLQISAAKLKTGTDLNWCTAEALAFGSLLLEGNHVRISGQDVAQGTFAHRLAALYDQKTGAEYVHLSS